MRPVRLLSRSLLLTLPAALAVACGSPEAGGPPAKSPRIECPDPIGSIERESCADIADDFGALSVSGALKLAGTGRNAEARIAAIRAAGAFANALKEERVKLCEEYDACKVAPLLHTTRDKVLAGLMRQLIDLWDARRFAEPDGVARFHDELRALHKRFDGTTGDTTGSGAPVAATPATPPPTKTHEVAGEALGRIEAAGVSFKAEAGAVTASATGDGTRDVLRSKPDVMPLAAGRRYQFHIVGSYVPATAPLVAPGEEVTVRLRYRAGDDAEVYAALRSIEDPEWGDAQSAKRVKKGDKGTFEASLIAASSASGLFVAVGARGGAAIELDDVEVVRGGKVIAAARAEDEVEPLVKTTCQVAAKKPLAGKRSFQCATATAGADLLTLGKPAGHLYVAVRGGSGDKPLMRTLSLEGGRSVDASLGDRGELIVGLSGPGTATIRSVQVRELEGAPR